MELVILPPITAGLKKGVAIARRMSSALIRIFALPGLLPATMITTVLLSKSV